MIDVVTKRRRWVLLICIALTAATLAVYAPVRHNDFVDFDDEEYITMNPHVRTGLTLDNMIWAFTTAHSNNWHPVTWISHMVDVEMFGLRPAGHHLVNVALHTLNGLLLFLLLVRMTGALWPCAFVAALFVLHPLHVESVAWAAERKDVLSAFFWLLTLRMYVHYAERPSRPRYAAVFLCLALGLMAKQMLVTLPFVLLLLDYWPLGRLYAAGAAAATSGDGRPDAKKKRKSLRREAETERTGQSWRFLVIEKIPFLTLAVLAAVTVFLVQLKSGVLYNLEPFPLQLRLENAVISYVAYIGKLFWPIPLAVFYPHPLHTLPWWQVLGALGFLLAITFLCWRYRRKRYLTVGWLWYLGTLVPVIGLVQVGVQAMADRYTYIPLIGLFVMIAWGTADLFRDRPYHRPVFAAAAAVVLLLCAWQTWLQVGTWRDRETLYAHAARVIPNNYWAYNNLGAAVAARGDLDEAMADIAKSLAVMPAYPGANKNMAIALYLKGRFSEALPYAQKALRFQPRNPEYQVVTGLILLKLGNVSEAAVHLQEALRLNPADENAREGLQEAMAKSGETNRSTHGERKK